MSGTELIFHTQPSLDLFNEALLRYSKFLNFFLSPSDCQSRRGVWCSLRHLQDSLEAGMRCDDEQSDGERSEVVEVACLEGKGHSVNNQTEDVVDFLPAVERLADMCVFYFLVDALDLIRRV